MNYEICISNDYRNTYIDFADRDAEEVHMVLMNESGYVFFARIFADDPYAAVDKAREYFKEQVGFDEEWSMIIDMELRCLLP